MKSLRRTRSLGRWSRSFTSSFLWHSTGSLRCGKSPFFGVDFEHTKSAGGASRRTLHRAVEALQQSKNFRAHLYDILIFGQGLFALFLLYLMQLFWEEFGIDRVDDCEQKFAVARRLATVRQVGQIAENSRVGKAV